MTRFTGPRMAIPTFKTPVETITPPWSEIFHLAGERNGDETTEPYKVRFLILKSFSA